MRSVLHQLLDKLTKFIRELFSIKIHDFIFLLRCFPQCHVKQNASNSPQVRLLHVEDADFGCRQLCLFSVLWELRGIDFLHRLKVRQLCDFTVFGRVSEQDS